MRNDMVAALGRNSAMFRFNPSMMRVGQVVLVLVCTCHWIGCLWWLVGTAQCPGGSGTDACVSQWAPSEELVLRASLDLQWGHAFLWGAATMTAMTPFDIVPETGPEVAVTTVAVFFGLFINIIIISSVTS
jgi:hypothetical protein